MAPETESAGWWKRHGTTALWLLLFFLLALFIRAYFNFEPSHNGGDWRWSGTDAYYHMRVIDHLVATGEFLLQDNLINYPVGATNPRPPLFDWTIAAFGAILAPLFGGNVQGTTEYVAAFSPAVWGALTVFPVYFLGQAAFSRRAGLWAAFLVAVMAAHVTRSNLGAVDHDATILFFFTLGAFFFVKALKAMKRAVYVDDYRRGNEILPGFKRFFKENQLSVVYALLTGVCFAAVALTWQGYTYLFAVFSVWYGFQLLANHLRRVDSTGYFVLGMLPFLACLVMIWPYYSTVFRIESYVYPTVYILVGMLVASAIFVPTRHLPPVLVLPLTAAGAILGLLLMLYVFPDIGRLFFTGLGYFVQSKLYSTIAEAQRTPLGYLVFSTGIIPFFFGLAGIFFALSSFVKKRRDDHLFVLVWAAVALLMAFTATRFVFNASVGFAVLAGWMVDRFIRYVRFAEVGKTWRNVRSAGYNFFKSSRSAVGLRHVLGALFLVFILLIPNVWFAVDAGVPGEYVQNQLGDEDVSEREREFWSEYFGAFGQDFLAHNWIETLDYLKQQDTDIANQDERPAFIAWWDYGFYAAQRGDHPAVADPFQFGYQISGRVLASQSESEAVIFMALRLLQADVVRGDGGSRPGQFTDDARQVLEDLQPGLSESIRMDLLNGDYDPAYAAVRAALGNETEADANAVSFYAAARDATGKSIRYFTLDGRMFPCDDPRTTTQIDSQSIFYAPVFLADKNPEDFVRTMYSDPQGQRYYQTIYRTTEAGGSVQRETPHVVDNAGNRYILGNNALFPMADNGYIDYNSPLARNGVQVTRQEMDYQESFYNTLLYRAWVGPEPTSLEEKVPLPSEYAPGANLKNFRLVFTTTRVAPEDNVNRCFGQVQGATTGYATGVSILKYYDGAPVEGVVRDSSGAPWAGATVRVVDNFGIPHDTVQTDENGRYTLMAPFSTENDPAPEAHVERPFSLRGTGLNKIQVVERGEVVAEQEFAVSDEQAMGQGPALDPIDLTIELGSIEGIVYEDVDGDGTFDETVDTRLSGAEVSVADRNATADDQGRFAFDSLRPTAHTVRASQDGYDDSSERVVVPAGGVLQVNISLAPTPTTVTGNLTSDGNAVTGALVDFRRADNESVTERSEASGVNGTYTMDLPEGTWLASVNYTTTEDNVTVRYFTESDVEISVSRNQAEATLDLTLRREEL